MLSTEQHDNYKSQKEFNYSKDQGRIASFVGQTGDKINFNA